MKLKWGKEKMYRISKKVPKAERYGDWIIWIILAIISFSGIIYLILGGFK